MGGGHFTGDAFIDGVSHNVWYSALLIGRSILGIHAGDIARLIGVVKKISPEAHIYAMARKEMTPLLLHAAAFIPVVERIALLEPLTSYRSLVLERFYDSSFIPGAVPASLTAYDLPDLVAAIAPRKLLIGRGLPDAFKNPGKSLILFEDIFVMGLGYLKLQADDQFQVEDEVSSDNFQEVMEEWIK